MLRERLHAEEARASRAEQGIVTLHEAQSRAAELEHQVQQWGAVSEANTSTELADLMHRHHRHELDVTEQLAAKSSQLTAAHGQSLLALSRTY